MTPTDETFVDDLYRERGISHPADGRHVLTWEGKRYTLYLTEKHYRDLQTVLEPYLDAAQKALLFRRDAVRSTTVSRADRERNKRMRAWGNDQGWTLPQYGPIPPKLHAAYSAAFPDDVESAEESSELVDESL